MNMLRIRSGDGFVTLAVKVVPGASRTRFLGAWDDRAKFAVAAPPEKGKANQALAAFLAKQLGVRRRDVSIIAGTASPSKTVRIDGVTERDIHALLEPHRS